MAGDPRFSPADAAAASREVAAAIAGSEDAVRRLVATLTPVIQARVARRLLLARPSGAAGSVRAEVEDLTQEVFLALFAAGGRALRRWDPSRGLSLRSYVGLVAERHAISQLRTGRHNPWTERAAPVEELDRPAPEPDPEEVAAGRERLRQILDRLEARLTPLGRQLFDLIYARELAPEEVSAATGLSPDAVYAWRSRLRRLVVQLAADSSRVGSPPSPRPGSGTPPAPRTT